MLLISTTVNGTEVQTKMIASMHLINGEVKTVMNNSFQTVKAAHLNELAILMCWAADASKRNINEISAFGFST